MYKLATTLCNAVNYNRYRRLTVRSIVPVNEDVRWVTSLAPDLLTENACTQPRFNRRVTMEFNV